MEVSRSSLRYQPTRRADEEPLRAHIRELARAKQRYGYRRITAQLRREGWEVNHKRVHRIWKQEGLALPRKRPKRGFAGPPGEVKQRARYPNHVWGDEFAEDGTEGGDRLRILAVIDE